MLTLASAVCWALSREGGALANVAIAMAATPRSKVVFVRMRHSFGWFPVPFGRSPESLLRTRDLAIPNSLLAEKNSLIRLCKFPVPFRREFGAIITLTQQPF